MLDKRIVNQFDQPTALWLSELKASRGVVPEISQETQAVPTSAPSAQKLPPKPTNNGAAKVSEQEEKPQEIDNIKLLKEKGQINRYTVEGPLQQNPLFSVVRDSFGLNPDLGYQNENLLAEVGAMAIELAGTESPARVFNYLQNKIKMVNTISDPLVQLIKLKRLLKIEQDQLANKYFHKQKQEKMKRIYLRESLGGGE